MSKLIASIIGAAFVASSSVAWADADEAKVHIDAAEKAHAAGDYDTALVELQAAYTFDPKPDLLYAIGQVYSKLGKCPEAKTFFERFRAASHDAGVAAVVKEAIAACKPKDAAAAPPPTPPKVEQPPPPKPEPPPPISARTSPWYTDVIGDALVGGGVVAAGVGLAFYVSARSDLDSAETAGSLASYHQLVEDAHDARTRSVILLGAGGALLVGGVVHYLLRDGGGQEKAAVGVAPTRGGAMLTWGTSL